MKHTLYVSLLIMLLSLPVRAEENPPVHAQEPSGSPPAAPSDRLQEENLFQPNSEEPALSRTAGPDDPLKVGGVFYLRMLSGARENQSVRDFRFSTPMLVDAYLDARPNDRVHAEFVGRINYDPTGTTSTMSLSTLPSLTSSTPSSTSTTASTSSTDPTFILNQLWIRFDIARTVFVTAGKQNIKWGTAHFWNPTDFLQPVRNPLEPFDVRTGTTMLKFHLPWEKLGWNFYAVALLDRLRPPTSQESITSAFSVGNLGGAVRAEMVFKTIEIGLDAVSRSGQRTKYGFDISAGLDSLLRLPIDIYAEVAIRHGSDTTRYRMSAEQPSSLIELIEPSKTYNPDEITPQVSCGLSWSTLYNDQDQIIIGAEYFYNSLGYDDIELYPRLILNSAFQPFYVGKHYAALYVSLPNPGSWDNSTVTLSSIGNLSDSSFVIRLDYSVMVLTYLKIEAYVSGYLGQAGGEFRFRIDTPEIKYPNETNPTITIPPIHLTAPIVDVGLSLRIDI
jgi:hypothetical protein